jgi:hypothetical protein
MIPENKVDINNIKLPYVIRDVLLFTPGKHNNLEYSDESINYAYQNTDWNDKTLALYLDHEDNYTYSNSGRKDVERGASVRNWVGHVANITFKNKGIRGDLYLLDMDTARKLAYGAKFGISPRGKAMIAPGQMMTDRALVENFAIVVNPAIKTAYINNGEDEMLIPYDNDIAYFAMSEVIEDNQLQNKMDADQMKTAILAEVTAALSPVKDLTAQVAKLSQDMSEIQKEREAKNLADAEKAKAEDIKKKKKDEEPDEDDKDCDKEMAEAMESIKTPEELSAWKDSIKQYGLKEAISKRKTAATEASKAAVAATSEKMSQLEVKVKELQEKLDTPNPKKSADVTNTGVRIDQLSDRELDMRFIGVLRAISGQEDDSIATIQRERGVTVTL